MDRNFEIIEKYIDGDLEGQELLDFEKLLATDPDIKRDYQLSLEINNSVGEDDIIALRETIAYMYDEESKIKRLPNVFRKRRFYYAAASVALLLATGGLVQRLAGPDLNNEAIFDKYYTPYEVTVTYRSGNEKIDKLLLTAMERYEEQDYEKALVLFEEVLESRKNDMAINLYSGISYMEEEMYNEAKSSFNTIISDNDNLFVEQAKWFTAMCYIKTENNEKAKEVLNNLIEEESSYKNHAIKVIKDLD